MKTILILSLLPLLSFGQTVAGGGRESVLVVLRQMEGPIGQRLAGVAPGTVVPEEVLAASRREQEGLAKAQRESLEARLTALGGGQVLHYPALNMVRVEVPRAAVNALQTDPAVMSVTAISGDVQPTPATAIPNASIGRPLLTPTLSGTGMMGGSNPAFMASNPMGGSGVGMPGAGMQGLGMQGLGMQGLGMPGMGMQGMGMQGMGMQGMSFIGQQPGFGGRGSMLQAMLGVTGQMGGQLAMAMPRAAGLLAMVAGGAQVAQVIVANRKQSCSISLDSTNLQIPAAGSQGSFAVRASPSCMWQAQSNEEWLHVDSDSPMVGSGLVRYTVAAGTGARRSGVITIAGIAKMTMKGKTSLTVTQGE
jgi:hypothetical protein